MQFSTIFIGATMAASAFALPALEARQAVPVVGKIDVYTISGCLPRDTPQFPAQNITAGAVCNTFPATSFAGNVTSLNTGCTVILYNDATCTSGSQITITPAAGTLKCQEPGSPGLLSYKATCTV